MSLRVIAVLALASCASPPFEWEGTWVGKTGGFLEVTGRRFLVSERPLFSTTHYPSTVECRALDGPGELACDVPDNCTRRVRIAREGLKDVRVTLLGGCWQGSGFVAQRTSPFEVVIAPFVEGARNSDLGSSGGRLFYALLGPDPEAGARRLSGHVERAVRAEGVDPMRLSVEAVGDLMGELQLRTALVCLGMDCEPVMGDFARDTVKHHLPRLLSEAGPR